MAKERKKRSSEEIKQAIVDYIETLDFPTTTGGIAEGVGLNWYAASFYLGQLKGDGKVFHKKVGRQNQWWTEKVDEQRKKIRELESVLNELEKRGIVVKKGKSYEIAKE